MDYQLKWDLAVRNRNATVVGLSKLEFIFLQKLKSFNSWCDTELQHVISVQESCGFSLDHLCNSMGFFLAYLPWWVQQGWLLPALSVISRKNKERVSWCLNRKVKAFSEICSKFAQVSYWMELPCSHLQLQKKLYYYYTHTHAQIQTVL